MNADVAVGRDSRRFVLLFAGILVASTGILIAVSALLFRLGAEHRAWMVRDVQTHAVDMRQEAMVALVATSVSDLLFLAELNEIAPFLEFQAPEARDALAREIIAFARGRSVHDRITILSPTGMELLRVDDLDGAPSLASEEDLRFLWALHPPAPLYREIARDLVPVVEALAPAAEGNRESRSGVGP